MLIFFLEKKLNIFIFVHCSTTNTSCYHNKISVVRLGISFFFLFFLHSIYLYYCNDLIIQGLVWIKKERECWLVGWLFGFYIISTFVGYLMPNPFFHELFYFKQFSLA